MIDVTVKDNVILIELEETAYYDCMGIELSKEEAYDLRDQLDEILH